MSQEQVSTKSRAICKQVIESDEYKAAETIFAYYPLGNEVNCLSVLNEALCDGKRVFLPRTGAECQMEFFEIHGLDDVEVGTFQVMEPKTYCRQFEPDIDGAVLVLVPGVVFDRNGNRYGYGKGYYDRYFVRFPQLMRMGLAYTEQVSEESLENLETDIRMSGIVTEEGRVNII